jgi:uncharacterized protein YwbE
MDSSQGAFIKEIIREDTWMRRLASGSVAGRLMTQPFHEHGITLGLHG